MSYVTANQVEAYLGTTFTPEQATYVTDHLIPTSEAAIAAYLGRTWQLTPTVGEHITLFGRQAWLQQIPVVSIEQVLCRGLYPGDPSFVAQAGLDYELLDPASGLLLLRPYTFTYVGSWTDLWATVDYTAQATPPSPVALAATQLVALGFQRTPAASGGGEGGAGGSDLGFYIPPDIQSYSVGNELAVSRFSPTELLGGGGAGASGSSGGVVLPPTIAALLAPYILAPVHFA